MAARQSFFDIGLGVHRKPVSRAISCWIRKTGFSFAFASAVSLRNDFVEGCG
jgi:hypothetical protein